MGAPRRSVKARPADEWKGRLREDVLERVRANRVAILSRARGEGASGASLRDEVDVELRQILERGARPGVARGLRLHLHPPPVRTLARVHHPIRRGGRARRPRRPRLLPRSRSRRLAPPSSAPPRVPRLRRRRHVGRRRRPPPSPSRASLADHVGRGRGHGRPERGWSTTSSWPPCTSASRRNFAPRRRRRLRGSSTASSLKRRSTSTQPWKISPTGSSTAPRPARTIPRCCARCVARGVCCRRAGPSLRVRTISPLAQGRRIRRNRGSSARGKFRARSPAASVGRRLRRAREGRVRERKPGVRGSRRVRSGGAVRRVSPVPFSRGGDVTCRRANLQRVVLVV